MPSRETRRRAGWGAALLLAAAAAFGQSTPHEPRVGPDGRPLGPDGRPIPSAAAPEPAKPQPLQVGETAPDFTLSALRGKRVALADTRGKVVLLDFWATWCPTCQASIRELKKLHEEFQGQPFTLVSVNDERDRVKLRDFVAAHQMDWPQAWDEWSKVTRAYRIRAVPTYLLLDRDGRIVHIQSGWDRSTAKILREKIGKALAAPAQTSALQTSAQPPAQRR
jgi:peroxiredoxin